MILHREGLLDIRLGQDDNTNNKEHPCPGLFETCCNLRSERPIIPPTTIHTGCGIRNVDGVGFRITGDKDNEAQFGLYFIRIYRETFDYLHFFECLSGEFPWTVAILKEEKALDGQILNVYVCGGSIIDPGMTIKWIESTL